MVLSCCACGQANYLMNIEPMRDSSKPASQDMQPPRVCRNTATLHTAPSCQPQRRHLQAGDPGLMHAPRHHAGQHRLERVHDAQVVDAVGGLERAGGRLQKCACMLQMRSAGRAHEARSLCMTHMHSLKLPSLRTFAHWGASGRCSPMVATPALATARSMGPRAASAALTASSTCAAGPA